MAQQIINVGILENDQTGDTLRDAFIKINENFTDLYVSSITLSGFSVGAEGTPSGDGGLAYDNTTGIFTYTPPTAAGLGALTDLTGTNFTTLADVTSVTAADNNKILYYDHGTGSFQWKTEFNVSDLTVFSVGPDATPSGDGGISYNNVLGVFTYTPPTASGLGALTDLTGTNFTTLADVDAAGAGQDGYILYYDHGTTSFKWKVDPVGLAYTDFSVNQNAASGAGTLTYNNGTGQFDYTPPDLSGFLTDLTGTGFTTLSDVDAAGASDDGKVLYYDHGTTSFKWKIDDDTPTGYNNTNWDTAYSWGDHSVAGYTSYADSDVDTHLNQSNPTAGYVLSWNGADYAWVDNAGYTNSDVDAHLNQSSPTDGYVLSWTSGDYAWVAQSGGGTANVTVSDAEPGSPSDGDLWWESDVGRLKVYYNDGSSSQWVDTNPPLSQGNESYQSFASTQGTSADISEGSSLVDSGSSNLELSITATSGFTGVLVTFNGSYYNHSDNTNHAGIRLQRKINAGSWTTIGYDVQPPTNIGFDSTTSFTRLDTHGATAGDTVSYRFINSTFADSWGSVNTEVIRMKYGISGDTFGIKEIR